MSKALSSSLAFVPTLVGTKAAVLRNQPLAALRASGGGTAVALPGRAA